MITLVLVLLLLFPRLSEAAIAVVQTTWTQGAGTNEVTTGDITSSSGNLFICDAGGYVAASSVDVTDSKSNTYSRPIYIGSAFDGQHQGGQWYVENGTGGATHNFTLTFDVSGFLAIVCKEVSGALTSGALDKTATKEDNGTSQTTGLSSGTTATTTQNDELWAGSGIVYNGGTADMTFTAQSGFTENAQAPTDVSNQFGIIGASKVVSTTGGAEFTYDLDNASTSGSPAWVATYKATTSAPTAARRRIILNP